MKKMKTFFYVLFALDVLASCVVAALVTLLAGIATAFVLLTLNISVYAIILKADKVGKNGTK
ncbi:MAG: hypothetical protein LE180_01045 [Endomicrobium sp.]|jgi:hypothetical protein|uniref:hypothetical protein n=1 Tax=Candidatus Endomicrobiellum pyrsonymphae TaxID=1408203 RepID=UPI00357C2E05|nr:hypothetical protein [Endomicrobium sp.]MCA6071999.1 hypothetical protein [Endomicrobium sp.]